MTKLNWPASHLAPAVIHPDWSKLNASRAPVARNLWFLLEAGLSVSELSEKLPHDRYTLLATLSEMVAAGLVRLATDMPSAAQPPPPAARDLTALINALNAVTANLGFILGRKKMSEVLSQALALSAKKYSHLSSLRIEPEALTLDLRMASPAVSQSQASIESFQYLTEIILQLAWQSGQVRDRQDFSRSQ